LSKVDKPKWLMEKYKITLQNQRIQQLVRRVRPFAALTYNWWSWYVRAANPKARLEALTSRPLLPCAVGRVTKTAGRVELHLTPMHAKVSLIKAMVVNVSAAVAYVKRAAEQLPKLDCWQALVRYISDKITGQSVLPGCLPMALANG
jgi:hypothetical protein